jgi:hypothetical protein
MVPLVEPLAGLTVSHVAPLVAVQATAGEIVKVNVPLPEAGVTLACDADSAAVDSVTEA